MGGGGGDALNRALDVAIAGTGLAITSPLLAAAAIAVKLGDGGPVLFRQTRVGKDGVDFDVLKLRTMVVGAESIGAGYAVVLAGQLGLLAAAAAGVPVARYYVLVSWATVQALANYVRHGVPATWDPAATR